VTIENRADDEEPRRERQLLQAERHATALRMVTDDGQATVGELVEVLRVSASTVRRDLSALAERGAVERVYGGAVRRLWWSVNQVDRRSDATATRRTTEVLPTL
jgi:DeoR/GlpR family transcriptional regulator of sugar metabolism